MKLNMYIIISDIYDNGELKKKKKKKIKTIVII